MSICHILRVAVCKYVSLISSITLINEYTCHTHFTDEENKALKNLPSHRAQKSLISVLKLKSDFLDREKQILYILTYTWNLKK